MLARELYGDEDDRKLKLVRTHDKHLPPEQLPFRAEPTIIMDSSTIMRADDNNVDIDIEMASLAKNQIYYNAVVTELNGHVSRLKNSITSNGQ